MWWHSTVCLTVILDISWWQFGKRCSVSGTRSRTPTLYSCNFMKGCFLNFWSWGTAYLQTILPKHWFWVWDLKYEWPWTLPGENLAPFSPFFGLENSQTPSGEQQLTELPQVSRLHTVPMQSVLILEQVARAGWDLFRGQSAELSSTQTN